MTQEQVKAAQCCFQNIQELEEVMKSGGIEVKAICEWHKGSAIFQHRREMMHAVKAANDAAVAVMRAAASRQIDVLRERLKELGVSDV